MGGKLGLKFLTRMFFVKLEKTFGAHVPDLFWFIRRFISLTQELRGSRLHLYTSKLIGIERYLLEWKLTIKKKNKKKKTDCRTCL